MTADNNAVDAVAAIIHAKGGTPAEMQPDGDCAVCAESRRIARAVLAVVGPAKVLEEAAEALDELETRPPHLLNKAAQFAWRVGVNESARQIRRARAAAVRQEGT